MVIDIDCLGGDLAIDSQNYCFFILGEAPVRIGKAQKRALYYHIDGEPLDKKTKKRHGVDGVFYQVEVLGHLVFFTALLHCEMRIYCFDLGLKLTS